MDLTASLTSLLGAGHVAAGAAAPPFPGFVPQLVASPGSAEEAAAVMRIVSEANGVVVPSGGGTRQRVGSSLAANGRPVVVLQTTRLTRVLDYTPDDMTISVEAGATMQSLAEAVAVNRQMFPVDVALPGRSTVGGSLVCAADGPRRLGYGTFRDLFLGVRVVEPGGRTSKAGGMTVKNVSGFDMMKLYAGSLGSLAVLVSANFKLLPAPRAAATTACQFDSVSAAFALVDAIHATKLVPVACEFVRLEGGEGFGVCVAAEGLEKSVARHQRDIAALGRLAGAKEIDALTGDEHHALWASIQDLPQSADLAADEIVLRLSTLPALLGEAATRAVALAHEHGAKIQISARALNGVGYFRVRGATLSAFHAALTAALPEAYIVILGAGTPDPAIDVWGRRPGGLETMRRIKAEFDPANLLNPGRFVV